MRDLFFIVLVGALAYFIYQNLLSPEGEFDQNGEPAAVLFTMDGCPPCEQAESFLKSKNISFELINVNKDPEAKARVKPYGNLRFPTLVVGDRVVTGYPHADFQVSLVKAFGDDVLSQREKAAYRYNFNEYNEPRVVMYGTKHCGYCAQAKKYFESKNIEYIEWDIEKNPSAARRYKVFKGFGTPLIFIGYERVDGFDRRRVKDALNAI